MIEILKKLRSNTPEWYERYVAAYEAECARQFTALLNAPPESLPKQQGVMAAHQHHLELLKQAK